MLLILSFEATDCDYFENHPYGIIVIELKDKSEKDKIINGINQAIEQYKKENEDWCYQDCIEYGARQWLIEQKYIPKQNKQKIEVISLG